jgi:hypothetical protein
VNPQIDNFSDVDNNPAVINSTQCYHFLGVCELNQEIWKFGSKLLNSLFIGKNTDPIYLML